MTGRFKQPIWIVPLVIAGLVAVFGWWGDHRLRQTIEDQLAAKLNSTIIANVRALEIWTTNQTRLATALAGEPVLRNRAVKILKRGPEPRDGGPLPDVQYAEQLNRSLLPRLNQLGYEVAQLVSTNFAVVTS